MSTYSRLCSILVKRFGIGVVVDPELCVGGPPRMPHYCCLTPCLLGCRALRKGPFRQGPLAKVFLRAFWGFEFHHELGNGISGGFASGFSTRRFGQVTLRNPHSQNFQVQSQTPKTRVPAPAQPSPLRALSTPYLSPRHTPGEK